MYIIIKYTLGILQYEIYSPLPLNIAARQNS